MPKRRAMTTTTTTTTRNDDDDGDDDDFDDASGARARAQTAPTTGRNGAAASATRSVTDVGKIKLTLEWISRTRKRSANAEVAVVKDVVMDVHARVTVKQLFEACVELPPGEHSCALLWGNYELNSDGLLHGAGSGGWQLDVFAWPPTPLRLIAPSGSLCRHPTLGAKARWKRCVPRDVMCDEKSLFEPKKAERGMWVKLGANGSKDSTKDEFDAAPTQKSRRALHPGRTDEHGMISLINDHNVFKGVNNGAIVDVGSGCGSLAAGLSKAFPTVSVCGIECQEDLVIEARRKFRDVHFINDSAENVLSKCRMAKIVVATTHNFDSETINYILRTCAELPMLTHLIVNEPHLCRPACRTKLKLCCCFEPLESREIKTHWGNSFLNFTIYKRHVRWAFGGHALPRGEEAAVALIEDKVAETFLMDGSETQSMDTIGR